MCPGDLISANGAAIIKLPADTMLIMDKKDFAETVAGTFEITDWMEGVKGCLGTKEMGFLLRFLREAKTVKFSKLSTVMETDWPNLPFIL